MTQDVAGVQPDAVPEGTVSPEVVTPEVIPPQTQPLTPDQISKMITQEVEKVKKPLTDEVERAKREIQSVKDRARAEVEMAQRRAEYSEDTLRGINAGFGQTTEDPERAELIRLRAETAARNRSVMVDYQRQQQAAFHQQFVDNMNQFITTMGVDPKDYSKIDWPESASNYFEVQSRIQTSVAKIMAEDKKTTETKRSQEIKDLEVKLRKDLGFDSVNTAATPPAAGSDAEFLDKFGKGEVPATKENVKRADKILKKLEKGE